MGDKRQGLESVQGRREDRQGLNNPGALREIPQEGELGMLEGQGCRWPQGAAEAGEAVRRVAQLNMSLAAVATTGLQKRGREKGVRSGLQQGVELSTGRESSSGERAR